MIKIVTRQHWRELVDKKNNAINELEKAKKLNERYDEDNRKLGIKCEELIDKLDIKDKEVRKLKALLTKNKIDYKHLYKGGK